MRESRHWVHHLRQDDGVLVIREVVRLSGRG
jgi:hypothetical protein